MRLTTTSLRRFGIDQRPSAEGQPLHRRARARAVRSHPSSRLEAEPQWTAVNSRLNRLIFSHHTLVVLMGKIGLNITRLALPNLYQVYLDGPGTDTS